MTTSDLPLAPAKFIGIQRCAGLMPDFELWNLTAAVEIDGKLYREGSSLSREFLEAAGYLVPPVYTPAQEARRQAWYRRPESMGTRHPFASVVPGELSVSTSPTSGFSPMEGSGF